MLDADYRGILLDHATTLPAMVRSISLEETRQVAQAAFTPDDFVWSIAGDLCKIEAEVRALNLGRWKCRTSMASGYGERSASGGSGARSREPTLDRGRRSGR